MLDASLRMQDHLKAYDLHEPLLAHIQRSLSRMPESYRYDIGCYNHQDTYLFAHKAMIQIQKDDLVLGQYLMEWLEPIFPKTYKSAQDIVFPYYQKASSFSYVGMPMYTGSVRDWLAALIHSMKHQPQNIIVVTDGWSAFRKPLAQKEIEALWLEEGYSRAMHEDWLQKLEEAKAIIKEQTRERMKKGYLVNPMPAYLYAEKELKAVPPPSLTDKLHYADADIIETIRCAVEYHYTDQGLEAPRLFLLLVKRKSYATNQDLIKRFAQLEGLFSTCEIKLVEGAQLVELLKYELR